MQSIETVATSDHLDVLNVANLLHFEHAYLESEDWEDCGEARYRSSVSRAFYSLFHRLRARLMVTGRFPAGFPEGGAHGKIKKALRVKLRGSQLTTRYIALCDERDLADYDLSEEFTSSRAESACDEAEALVKFVNELPDDAIMSLAMEIGG